LWTTKAPTINQEINMSKRARKKRDRRKSKANHGNRPNS
jgi:hypothetical protein